MKKTELLDLLFDSFDHSVNDVIHSSVPFTKEMKDILKAKSVDKLNRIRQNGPAYLIYPSNVHTRLNHSIGVYAIGRKIILTLLSKNESLPFSKEGVMSFFIACLLHDIGHFPYAHSLKELSVREHEEIAEDIILHDRELYEKIKKAKGVPEYVGLIINKERKCGNEEIEIYRNILSGTLDPDKLDYLSRDAYFSGVPYGMQHTEFILKSLDLRKGRLVLDEDALISVEQILFSKYMMYRTVYWHKGVRCATSMIKKALVTALEENKISYDDLYFKDDYEFASFAREKRKEIDAFSLIEMVESGQLFEKKAEIPLSDLNMLLEKALPIRTRAEAEREIYNQIKAEYPALKDYEVIIDIPEPINFESHIEILRHDGSVSPVRDDETIFTENVGSEFSKRLRKLSVFAPSYVKEADVMEALGEVDFGKAEL